MQCPECQFDNPEEAVFCCKCGTKFESLCHGCGYQNPPESSFCCKCGSSFSSIDVTADDNESAAQGRQAVLETGTDPNGYEAPDSERKYVTVMFSDLTGYTEISERLDPEEVKEITGTIFSKLTKIIEKFDGFIEKYIGDAILAVFGAKEAFEDNSLRAIKAAREIHQYVETVSPKYEEIIGRQLSMHTGINTGLVVTGEINYQKGTHGLVGDTINTAARLMSISQPGEIIADHDSYVQTQGYFEFDSLEPVKVKGKAEPIKIYRVGDTLQTPQKLHRLHGLRAELIGRSIEMQVLKDAAESLEQDKGSVVSVCGTAGTGKSRLIHEFKKTLDHAKFQWFYGSAYPYTQNTPYYPLIDLLTKAFGIEESDSPELIKQKVDSSLGSLLGKEGDKVQYIGGLFSIEYSETSSVSPEYWKNQLYFAMREVLKALTTSRPTIICLEDMHWADPSTMELVKKLVSNLAGPQLVILVYRPVITVFTDNEIQNLKNEYIELRLRELSPSESQHMACSLLRADQIPKELRSFIRDSIDGNPFYIEELINSLVDSEALSMDAGQWTLAKDLDESFISTNIQGVVTGRIDRLGSDTKRILQEASVIGRAFLFDILQRISEIRQDIDKNLVMLERLDLISARSIQPSLEYIFKHALTQEIVYNGLLIKDRCDIHERVGLVMENVFENRLSEFYETLAFHFSKGKSIHKGIRYLLKSGEKCLSRYAVEEAHEYFKKAYSILTSKDSLSEEEQIILIDLLNSWGYAFYYLGEFKQFIDIFSTHQNMADFLKDNAKVGMFYAWFGIAHWMAGQTKVSFDYLRKGLELGEKTGNQKVVGYACSWLTWACGELGLFAEGIGYGERSQKIAGSFPSDPYLFFKSLGGLCWIYFCEGDPRKIFDSAERLLEYGERNANSRSKVMGHWMKAFAHWLAGDMKPMEKSSEKAVEVALDPFYGQFPKTTLGFAHFYDGRLEEAEKVFQSTINFCKKHGVGAISVPCNCFLAPILIAKGQMQQGTDLLEKTRKTMIRNHRKVQYAMSEYIFGEVYSQIATGQKPSLSIMAKNIGFLAKNVPFAAKKAEKHFNKAIDLLKGFGNKSQLGQTYLSLGSLYKATKRTVQAKQCILEAIDIFQECEAGGYLKQAKEVLNSIAVEDM